MKRKVIGKIVNLKSIIKNRELSIKYFKTPPKEGC